MYKYKPISITHTPSSTKYSHYQFKQIIHDRLLIISKANIDFRLNSTIKCNCELGNTANAADKQIAKNCKSDRSANYTNKIHS